MAAKVTQTPWLTTVILGLFVLQMFFMVFFFGSFFIVDDLSIALLAPGSIILFYIIGIINLPLLLWHGKKNQRNRNSFQKNISWTLISLSIGIGLLFLIAIPLSWSHLIGVSS